MITSTKKFNITLIFLILSFAIFIRAYNINYDNFWFDEILSFWITDPKLTFKESFARHLKIEQIPYLYHFFLKINFEIFSYNNLLGRYLSLIFNILGICFATLLCKNIKDNNSYLLSLFLFSTNIFLIGYSQELRPYSLIFFLSSLNLYLFFKIHTSVSYKKFDFFYYFLITLSQIFLIISHPFSIIIFFSTSLFIGLNFFLKKKNSLILVRSFYLSFIFLIIYLYFYLKNLDSFPSWITQPDLKFYTNFYFSKFFGSRLMGLVHLLILISLTIFFFRKFKDKNFNLNIFLIIIFLSYLLPLSYGYLIKPIIFPRYIIFVLVPIVILLSILIYEIKNKTIRGLMIFIIVILNIGNHFTESTFQQFYKERPFYKSNFEKMINTLSKSDIKFYTIEMPLPDKKKESAYEAINNYIFNLKILKNSKINFIKKEIFLKSDKEQIWLICLPDVVKNKCKDLYLSPNDEILYKKNIPGIKMLLIKKTK